MPLDSCRSREGWGCGVKALEPPEPASNVASVPFFLFFHGQVPEYLVSRQEEWEREADRLKAEAPDPSCPPGMKLMPEEDRLQTLRQLRVRN